MKANGQPSEVLILRGLACETTEKMILQSLSELNQNPDYVRIIKDKLSGLSKGIAIVRFKSVEDANLCLELHQVIEINDSSAWFEFGFEHSNEDWTCKSCQCINFQHRTICFKCSAQKSSVIKKLINDGREDISTQPTRFILIRGFEDTLNSKMIYEKIFMFDQSLKRVWLVEDSESHTPKSFAFLEFSSILDAESFIFRQTNFGIPFKINCNEVELSFGRDLELLSQLNSETITGMISYWDPNLEFSEYPTYIIKKPETAIISKNNTPITSGILTKRSAFGAVPLLNSAPPKKLQIQLKQWTEKAKISEIESSTLNFIPEEIVNKSKVRKEKFIDKDFLCCLLCDIKFINESELIDHAQNSDEHDKKFVEYLQQSTINDSAFDYHDRAAERRDAFGEDEEEIKRKLQESISASKRKINITEETKTIQIQTSSNTTPDYSIGAKLLKKMGWKEGSGLGKDSTGIVEPIKGKTLEHSGAGIGAASLISADEITSKSYNEKVRNEQRKRYTDER